MTNDERFWAVAILLLSCYLWTAAVLWKGAWWLLALGFHIWMTRYFDRTLKRLNRSME